MSTLLEKILSGENETTKYKSSFNTQVIESLTAFANTKSGIRRVREFFMKENLPAPEFKEIANGFFAVVRSKDTFSTVEENDHTVEKTVEENDRTVEKTVEEIIAAIRKNPQITQNQLMKITGLTRRGIEWNLSKLKTQGRLKRLGATKGGYWELVK